MVGRSRGLERFEISAIFALLGSIVVYFLGGADTLLIVAGTFIFLDLVTGLSKGAITKTMNSNKGWKGILRKTMYLVAIGVGEGLDKVTVLDDAGLSFRTVMLCYVIGTEGISILENLSVMGIKMPKKIESILEKLKDDEPD